MIADYADIYDPETDFDRWYTALTARRIRPLLGPGEALLELGSATGLLTEALVGEGRRFTCIERSPTYLARARARLLPDVHLVQASIESFASDEAFDHVLAINVLHELPDWRAAVARLAPLLAAGGLFHVTLPNPASLHRLSAKGAGLIGDLCESSERGRRFGTVGLQTPDAFVAGMTALGLREVRREAILVKPLPNDQMALVSPDLIEAWDALSHALPAHGAMTWFVFRNDHG